MPFSKEYAFHRCSLAFAVEAAWQICPDAVLPKQTTTGYQGQSLHSTVEAIIPPIHTIDLSLPLQLCHKALALAYASELRGLTTLSTPSSVTWDWPTSTAQSSCWAGRLSGA